MKLYGVYEGELNTLSVLTGITGLFASFGTGLIAFAAGQAVDLAKGPTPDHPEVAYVVCVICVVGALACYVVAGVAAYFRRSQLSKIYAESRPRTPTP